MPRKKPEGATPSMADGAKATKAKAPAKASQKARGGKKAKASSKTAGKKAQAPGVTLKTAEGIVTPTVTNRKVGRPTDYRDEYCEQVVEWGRQGKSRVWMATRIGVISETLSNWAKEHPEFFAALTLAKELEQAHWEDLGQENIKESGFSASTWSRSMAARFPRHWAEKKQIDHGVTDALAALLGEIDGNGARLV